MKEYVRSEEVKMWDAVNLEEFFCDVAVRQHRGIGQWLEEDKGFKDCFKVNISGLVMRTI